MWQILANLLGGPIVTGLINAYKAKLDAGNTSDKIAADLAARELAVEQREKELASQIVVSEEGRWWTAAPRALVCYLAVFYIADKEFGWGLTHIVDGSAVAVWFGWLMAMWFGGRSFEKIARIIKR